MLLIYKQDNNSSEIMKLYYCRARVICHIAPLPVKVTLAFADFSKYGISENIAYSD